MTLLHPLLAFLHVLSISVWMAAALWVAGDVRRTLASGRPHVDLLPQRVRPALGLDAAVRLGLLAAVRRAFRSIAARLRAGETVPTTDPAARRVAMLSGIAHTLWLLALAGMIFPI